VGSDPVKETMTRSGAWLGGLDVVPVVVPGSGLGDVVVVVVVVLGSVLVVGVVSVLDGAVVVAVSGVEEVGVLDGATAEPVVTVVVPAVPAAATLGVVVWPSTVGSVCVCVRPGSTLGLGLAFGLVVAPAACLAAVLSRAFFADVLAAGLWCGCLTARRGWVRTETPPDTCAVGVVATGWGAGTTEAWVMTA
jgi:hypothetical protein